MIITTNGTGLRVELHGREQVWAMRAKVDMARETIKDIRFEPVFRDWRKWEVRIPGTAVPRLLFSGSYWTEEGWDFLFIKRPRGIVNPVAYDVLVIETDQNRYTRVIVSVTPEEAKRIIRWWNRKTTKTPAQTKSQARTEQAKQSAPKAKPKRKGRTRLAVRRKARRAKT